MSTDYAGSETFPATIPIPDDGDPRSASSVGVPFEGVMDAARYLKNRGVIGVYSLVFDDETAPFTLADFDTTSWAGFFDGSGYVDVPNVRVGDVLACGLSATIDSAVTPTGNGNGLRLYMTQGFGGGSPASAAVPGARALTNAAAGVKQPMAFGSQVVATVAGTARIFVQGKVDTAGGGHLLRIQSAMSLTVQHVRLP